MTICPFFWVPLVRTRTKIVHTFPGSVGHTHENSSYISGFCYNFVLTVVVQLHRETYINTILRYTLRSTSGRRVSIQPSVSTNRYPVASTPTIISIQPSISIKRSVSSQSSLPTFSIIPTIGFNEAFNEQPSNRYPVASTPITISTQPSISIKRWN